MSTSKNNHYRPLIQLLSAAKLIARLSGATIDEMAEKLDTSKRNVYRILDALEELGYPCYPDKDHGNRYKLVDSATPLKYWVPLPSISFDLEDRVLLDYLFDATSSDPSLAPAMRKLHDKLSFVGSSAGYCFAHKEAGAGPIKPTPRLLSAMPLKKAPTPKVESHFEILLKAQQTKNVCELSYESRESGSVKTYPVHPLALFESEGGLYCFIEVPRYGSIRTIALERIREVVVLDEKFEMPKGFDAEKRLADPFGIVQDESFAVKLLLSEDQAPYVRDFAWPDSYRFEETADGSLLMSFETGGAFGLKRWILSWGADVVVVEPEWLREEISKEAKAINALYVKALNEGSIKETGDGRA